MYYITMIHGTFAANAESYSFVLLLFIGLGVLALKDIFEINFTPFLHQLIMGWSTGIVWVI